MSGFTPSSQKPPWDFRCFSHDAARDKLNQLSDEIRLSFDALMLHQSINRL